MKTDSTKILDEMLKENVSADETIDKSSEIEKSMNEALSKMTEAFDKKIQEATDNVNKIIEKYEKENENNGNSEKESEEDINPGNNGSKSIQGEEE